jgi:tRNA nucleotidyltransferase (CCA-adding enzyme)
MNTKVLSHLDKQTLSVVKQIGRQADKLRLRAYLVGGMVRDSLLKRKNLDLDIVVEGEAIRLAEQWAKITKGRLIVHPQFGTAAVQGRSGRIIDFAMARREDYPQIASLPVVQPGTMDEDLFRRDIRINAMAVSLNKDSLGRILDPYHGMEDLNQKRIRVLHARSFRDDPTRILRVIRFEQRFDFRIDSQTREWLKEAFRKEYPAHVKPQRYFAEFKKILKEEHPQKSLRRLRQFRALNFLQEHAKLDLSVLSRIEQNLRLFKKKKICPLNQDEWMVIFAGLLFKLSAQEVENIVQEFNLSRTEQKVLMECLQFSRVRNFLKREKILPSDIVHSLKRFSSISLVFFWSMSENGVVRKHIVRFLKSYQNIRLFINGEDLKKLGVRSGETIGRILLQALNERMNGKILTRKAQLDYARQLI